MTYIEDRTRGRATDTRTWGAAGPQPELGQEQGGRVRWGAVNVGPHEQTVSLAAGSILALVGLARRSVPGMLLAGLGGALIYRGATGRSPLYSALGINTAEGQEREASGVITIRQAFTIHRPAEELYNFWHNFENLPRFMTHLESVRTTGEGRSHWVAKAPRLAGGQVEWDAQILRDEPSRLIAWQSLPGSTIDTRGEVRFRPALGDRGTEVHIEMEYLPPMGKLGHWIASLFGENPKRVVREDLRNFKRLMEMGEILTIIGQPHGTCKGQGERYTESDWKPLFT